MWVGGWVSDMNRLWTEGHRGPQRTTEDQRDPSKTKDSANEGGGRRAVPPHSLTKYEDKYFDRREREDEQTLPLVLVDRRRCDKGCGRE
jgi:hypothetical protein